MRFTLLAASAACLSVATRPDLARASVGSRASRLGDIVWKIQSGGDRLAALKAASSLLAESGGPDGHITPEDEDLFREVIEIVEDTIYSSMDDAHAADVAALDAAVGAAAACNARIAERQSPEGDLGTLHQSVQNKQVELNRLQGVVDAATEANNTAYDALVVHMQLIAPAPICPDFPESRTMAALDVYFEESEYSVWYTASQTAYHSFRADFDAANEALVAANKAYNIGRAIRDTQYCDWKSELLAACAAFSTCFNEATASFIKLKGTVTRSMNSRIEIKKAGDTLIHQLRFLLGEVADQDTPEIDTSSYQIVFPKLPEKGLCDVTPLTSDEWVPPVDCGYLALDVATAWTNHFDTFGAQDLDGIMLDYHEGSVLQIFNDACDANGGGVLNEFVGVAAIRGFFADLFATLGEAPGINLPAFNFQGTAYDNPTVEDGTVINGVTNYDAANVFLVWQSVDEGILYATDTFTWENTQRGVQIELQTIVATEPQACPANPPKNLDAPVPDAGNPITLGWDNHFNTFGSQDRKGILADYTEASEIQVWSWGGRDEPGYSKFTGLNEIGDMFDSLWANINSQTVNGDIGLAVPQGFPRVETESQTVFLTWSSYSNPKATDTFLFDDQGKILRQTIVTTTGVAPS